MVVQRGWHSTDEVFSLLTLMSRVRISALLSQRMAQIRQLYLTENIVVHSDLGFWSPTTLNNPSLTSALACGGLATTS